MEKQKNPIMTILLKSVTGFFLGVTLLIVNYVSAYFICGDSFYQNEILQLQNINTLIIQSLIVGFSYFAIFLTFFTELYFHKIKFTRNHPFFYALIVLIYLFTFVIIFNLLISSFFSVNIGMINIIILSILFIISSIIVAIKCVIDSAVIKEINNKIKERNKKLDK